MNGKPDYLGEPRLPVVVDVARMLCAAIAMHGLLASPIDFKKDEIVSEAVELADKLIKRLEETTK